MIEIKLEYEYFYDNLRKEIDLRKNKTGSHFSVWQMCRIVFDLIDLFGFLETNGINHGEINPTLIFLVRDVSTELFRPKVCERLSGCGDKFINSMQGVQEKSELYLCPQLFEVIMSGVGINQTQVDSYKSEVFSLGRWPVDWKDFAFWKWGCCSRCRICTTSRLLVLSWRNSSPSWLLLRICTVTFRFCR